MATNPKIPQQEHPSLNLQPPSKVPWVLIAIIAAAALLVACILWLPRAPKQTMAPSGAQVPEQPTGAQIQFTHLNLTASPTGNAVTLQGQMTNQGSSEITGVLVEATFKGKNGQNVGTMRVPVLGVEGGSNSATQPLTDAPVKAGETRPVRMEFANTPEQWNRELPELSVITVTAAGQPVSSAGQPPILNEQNNQSSQSGKNPPQNGAANAGQMAPGGKGAKKPQ